jgi:hypothetical protein
LTNEINSSSVSEMNSSQWVKIPRVSEINVDTVIKLNISALGRESKSYSCIHILVAIPNELLLIMSVNAIARSQWPRGLRHGSTAARLILGSNPAGGMDVCLL